MGNFDRCHARTQVWEKGNDDDKDDPGGRTSRGCIQSEYDRYRDAKGLPRADVWLASDAEIRDIFRTNYWLRVHGDELDDGVAMCLFDAAVLNGVGQTAKWVQRALGPLYAGEVDGDFGPRTFLALSKVADNDLFIADVCARRVEMMRGLKHAPKYIKGWTARVNDIKAVSQAWATGSVGPDPHPLAGVVPTPKAKPADLKAPVVSSAVGNTITAVSGVGSALAGAAATVSDIGKTAADAAQQLQPVVYLSPKLAAICAVLTVVGVVAGLFASWAARRHAALANGGA